MDGTILSDQKLMKNIKQKLNRGKEINQETEEKKTRPTQSNFYLAEGHRVFP